MKIIDLHQDISSNCMYITHKNFFQRNAINQWWNQFGRQVNNQSDLPRLLDWWVSVVFGAMCLIPSEMNLPITITKQLIQYQIDFYKYLETQSKWQIKIIYSYKDIDSLGEWQLWIVLHMEWFYFIDEQWDLSILDNYFDQWIRSIWLTWNVDNVLAWWASSENWLTELWRKFVSKLSKMPMILDLAHLNPVSTNDILNNIDFSPFVTHTQINSIFNHPRNLTDIQIIDIAQKWWVIWLMPNPRMLGSTSLDVFVDSISYVKKLVWIDYVAIWTDFDGTTSPQLIAWFDQSSDFPNLIDKLFESWFEQNEISKILFENPLRILKQRLS